MYLQLKKGKIVNGDILVESTDLPHVINLKRGIASSLQHHIDLHASNETSEETFSQVNFVFYNRNPLHSYTPSSVFCFCLHMFVCVCVCVCV